MGTTGFLGVLAGQLPGVYLFQPYRIIEVKFLSPYLNVTNLVEFSGLVVPYLLGSISLVVLAVGSVSPGNFLGF